MEFSQVVKTRSSVRAFRPEQITEEQLNAVLTAAQNAPVGMGNFQFYHLTVVQDPALLAQLESIAGEIAGQADFHPSYGAPTMIYVSAAKEQNDLMAGSNVSCIIENMLLAAVDQGIGGCYIMGMVQIPAADPRPAQLLQLPEDFRPVCAVALGYPAQEPQAREVGNRMEITYLR